MAKLQRIQPEPGQESVWDYPRPPALELTSDLVVIEVGGRRIVETRNPYRVLETSHPPVYYIDPADIQAGTLRPAAGTSFCEWKGAAGYYDVVVSDEVRASAAWYYPTPSPRFVAIRDFVAFYPSRMDACFVNGERVQAQDGDFYGGWITAAIVGPFKGGSGTWGW